MCGPFIGAPYGTTYVSVRVTEGGVEREFVVGTRLRVEVRKDGIAIAHVGCNQLSGVMMRDDRVLRFELHFRTEMGCGAELEAQDDWFVELVQREHAWVVDGHALTLTSGGTTVVLVDRRIAEPNPPLDGTTWIVEAVVLGKDGPFQHYADSAILTISGDRVNGSIGSRLFSATVARDDGVLTFTELTFTPPYPTGDALERAVLENLRTPLTYAIEDNRLELRGPTRATGLNLIAVRPDGNQLGRK